MVDVKDKGILLNMIDHCNRVEEKISSVTRTEFDNSKDMKDIVCFNIFQIGELAKHLSEAFIAEFNGVPWHKIKGMRNIIGHGYGTLKMDRVWITATKDIIQLKEYCESVIAS